MPVPPLLILSGVVAGGIYVVSRLTAPWREYRAKHIAPLEAEIETRRAKIATLTEEMEKEQANAELFSRNFKAEARRFQQMRQEGHDEQAPLKARREILFPRQEQVKASLNEWHRHAQGGFLGNRGRKIPQQSFLGLFGLEQTLSQRDSLQYDKETISNEIYNCGNELKAIWEAKIKPAMDGLDEIESAKARLRRFRDEGLNAGDFKRKASHLKSQIDALEAEISDRQTRIQDLTDAYTNGTTS